jgi:hypothetical protein
MMLIVILYTLTLLAGTICFVVKNVKEIKQLDNELRVAEIERLENEFREMSEARDAVKRACTLRTAKMKRLQNEVSILRGVLVDKETDCMRLYKQLFNLKHGEES